MTDVPGAAECDMIAQRLGKEVDRNRDAARKRGLAGRDDLGGRDDGAAEDHRLGGDPGAKGGNRPRHLPGHAAEHGLHRASPAAASLTIDGTSSALPVAA